MVLIPVILVLLSNMEDGTNLTHAGSLLGAGCCSALEFLLNARHKVGAGPRGGVGRALCGGRASLEDWHFKPFQSLMKFSLTWRKNINIETFSNINEI